MFRIKSRADDPGWSLSPGGLVFHSQQRRRVERCRDYFRLCGGRKLPNLHSMQDALSLEELRARYDDADPAQSSSSDAAAASAPGDTAAACAQEGTQSVLNSERLGNSAREAEMRSDVGTAAAAVHTPGEAYNKPASESDVPSSEFSDLELQDYLELHDGASAATTYLLSLYCPRFLLCCHNACPGCYIRASREAHVVWHLDDTQASGLQGSLMESYGFLASR